MDTESGVETDGDPDGYQGAVPYDTGNFYVDKRFADEQSKTKARKARTGGGKRC
jgi:hypothetical protein